MTQAACTHYVLGILLRGKLYCLQLRYPKEEVKPSDAHFKLFPGEVPLKFKASFSLTFSHPPPSLCSASVNSNVGLCVCKQDPIVRLRVNSKVLVV